MQLELIDWAIVIAFFLITLAIGAAVSRRAGKDTSEFFLSGRQMPWWLLGFSMVATTFSADTPLLVTDIVRKGGVAGNWVWWAFLLTGMLTAFVYAKLWSRSGVLTDIEFYELRYSGRAAAFLRGFRALYLGILFNVLVMASVTLAAIKIGAVMLGLSPLQTILVASVVSVVFSAMGGLRGVLITDCILFVVAMIGAIGAAVVAVQHANVQGLAELFDHQNVQSKTSLFPAFDLSTTESKDVLISVLLMPLLVQWWSVWYPGAEPGGGGYVAQRMLAARSEKHATGATLFFNAAHYALRPWPWIIVALASLIVFPDTKSLAEAFPHVPADKLNDDLAYPAMLTFLPAGLRGLVVASLIAAFMSTISTHLNWGASYISNDFWKRFIRPASSQRQLVTIGRVSTVFMMVIAGAIALMLENALQGFQILLQIGAGTGLLFILRWFWWRINAYSEITAMIVSFLVAFWSHQYAPESMAVWMKLILGVSVTTAAWLLVTFLTPPDDEDTLRSFYATVYPGGPGWRRVIRRAQAEGQFEPDVTSQSTLGEGLLAMLEGCVAIFGALFAIGFWLYGQHVLAIVCVGFSIRSALIVATLWEPVHW